MAEKYDVKTANKMINDLYVERDLAVKQLLDLYKAMGDKSMNEKLEIAKDMRNKK